ncbi:M1 family metallopeptidase [Sphingomonas donggukensis]|uniref:Aminopeptidase n=1 Tax=Sphingomonas donggukensis TaxID=2949093 RepID=A0ABY4TVH3_9SPHN|nr:M1 family metallopeptidase [Sphingomonas donggukensis]URW76391.1 M1 family metallopeptidase [Sphingomonas donggukensis]
MKKLAVAALMLTASSPALAQGQLPRTVVPVSYDIRVEPNAQAMTFSGSETILVRVTAPTRTIVLNAADLDVTLATFDGQQVKVATDAATQRLTVTLPRAASVGNHRLAFGWSGKINTSAAGLFAIDYADPDGKKQRMLATQFEAPDARRFAPMWDEPSFKAKFTLAAVAPKGQLAFSNMPARVTKLAGDKQLYTFAESPIMSSYLLYLGMGEVERKTIMAGKTEIGVITRKGVVDQGDYALKAAKDLLGYYNNYFGVAYPLPKMDMIAGPGSSQFFGAMENWGAIFYFEPELLFDAKRASVSNQQRIYSVVAHEMAHQWFGDLVTMRWWDDLWLNEGFASWMEGKATSDLNPQWQYADANVGSEREAALRLDATAATHPVIRKVETVDQIGEAFDTITYQKGQAVIGMLESTVGETKFRDGVRRYMAKYKYNNTVTDQLWAEVSAASGRDVAPFMHDFTLQGGVPLISVANIACAGGRTTARFTQTRFGLDAASKTPQTWRVPVGMSVLGGVAASREIRGATAQAGSVAGCGTLVVNPGKAGYYRVRYDAAGHSAIVRDFGRLAVADQLGTLGDDMALGYSGDQDLARYFETLDAVSPQSNSLVWTMVTGQMARLADLYDGTPLGERLKAKTLAQLAPALDRVGLEPKRGDSAVDTNLRETLVAALGAAGDPRVLTASRRYVGNLGSDMAKIPPAVRAPILRTFAANASIGEWEALLKATRAENNPVIRNQYIGLLGSANDPMLAQRALDLVKASEFTDPQRISLLAAVAGRHPDMAFDFASANAATINPLLETSSRSSFIVQLGGRSNDPAMIGKIQKFAQTLPAGSRGPADRTINSIRNRAVFADRLRPAVTKWAE